MHTHAHAHAVAHTRARAHTHTTTRAARTPLLTVMHSSTHSHARTHATTHIHTRARARAHARARRVPCQQYHGTTPFVVPVPMVCDPAGKAGSGVEDAAAAQQGEPTRSLPLFPDLGVRLSCGWVQLRRRARPWTERLWLFCLGLKMMALIRMLPHGVWESSKTSRCAAHATPPC